MHLSFAEAISLGVGVLALVVPYLWPRMPKYTSYSLAFIGFALIGYSGIILLQNFTGIPVRGGPLIVIVFGLICAVVGALWHIHLASNKLSPTLHSSEPKVNGEPKTIINQNIASYNQTGGITAYTVNQAPPPELKVSNWHSVSTKYDFHVIEFDLEVIAPYPPAQLYFQLSAPNFIEMSITPQRTGMEMRGHSGKRPQQNMEFTTIMSPFGKYKVVVKTSAPISANQIRIDYNWGI